MFEVLTPATDRTLLTITELREAAGVADGTMDTSLLRTAGRIYASMIKACRVATDGIVPPTFRLESVRDTFRSEYGAARRRRRHVISPGPEIYVSRNPVVSVASVTENDVVLVAGTDYEVHKSSGCMVRLSSDRETCWPCGKIIIAYDAGWSTVPDELKAAAFRFMQLTVQQGGRDPLLRGESVPGVLERSYTTEVGREISVPPEVMDALERGGYVQEVSV